MLFKLYNVIKRKINIIFYIVVIAALLIVTGTFTYSRYTYHYETTVTVTVPATKCSSLGLTLSECVIAFEGGTTNINTAKSNIEDKGTPDFSVAGTTDEGMYAAEDDYGTSYYYRGAVEDNYVYFAGYYWRIIRVNGDGSVRLIYDGSERTYANGESSEDRYIGTSAFNVNYDDNTYVGYMTAETTSTTYDATHNNEDNSTIKTYIDNWYESEFLDTEYEDYLSDEVFCNDRSICSGTGIGTTTTYYSGYDRLYTNKNPVLTCTNQNDEFTVQVTTLEDGTKVGNQSLEYPIGLITADEVAMAGSAWNTTNKFYYLYVGEYYWTITPFNDDTNYALNVGVSDSGELINYRVFRTDAVRPVINLSADVYVSGGTGKMDDPYEVTLDNPNTLSKKMLLNSTGESTVSDAITAIEAKGDPDYSTIAPAIASTSYTDNLPTSITTVTASSRSMSSYSSRYYTYSSSYTFDETTGKYSLVDAEVGQYSSIYSDLGGKYVVSYSGSTSSTAATSTNLSTIYYVASSTTSSTLYYISSTTTTNYEYDYSGDGLYATEDDYGTSYYYRGAVEDNYVYFAGYYWRIIRRNGDGSVRMIYDGTIAHANGDSDTDRYYTTKAFNSSYNDNAYVGYMYGTTSASTYDEAHTNTNNSTIKGVIDSFYTTKIQGQVDDNGNSLEDYLSDEVFCNDRSLYSGTGLAKVTSYYYGYNRLYTNKSPVLNCTNQNDEFTVETTKLEDGTEVGNGDLTYPIGLITADEVAMAGGVYNTTNKSYYLYTGSYFWTMTPSYFYGNAGEWIVTSSGDLGNKSVDISNRARPVVNLSSEVLVESGTGTSDDPYIVTLAN